MLRQVFGEIVFLEPIGELHVQLALLFFSHGVVQLISNLQNKRKNLRLWSQKCLSGMCSRYSPQ